MPFIRRELALQIHHISNLLWAMVFFVMVLSISSIAIGYDGQLLRQLAPSLVWIAVLLAVILNTQDLFKAEIDNGWLEQLVAHQQSVTAWLLAKLGIVLLSLALSLGLLCLLCCVVFALPTHVGLVLLGSIMLSLPSLILLCALAQAVVASANGLSILAPLICLPLLLPMVIFATGACSLASSGDSVAATLALLAGLSLLSIVFLPLCIHFALKYCLH